MKSILLMSILASTFVLPVWAARDPDVKRGLRRMAVAFVLFVCAYRVYVAYGHTLWFVPAR